MPTYQIAVVVGSLRRESFNRKLASAIVKLAPPEFSFVQVQIDGCHTTIRMRMAIKSALSSV